MHIYASEATGSGQRTTLSAHAQASKVNLSALKLTSSQKSLLEGAYRNNSGIKDLRYGVSNLADQASAAALLASVGLSRGPQGGWSVRWSKTVGKGISGRRIFLLQW